MDLRHRLLRVLAWALAGLACALVFTAWRNPHLALEVSQFIRSCF